jgi:hypothetical protein
MAKTGVQLIALAILILAAFGSDAESQVARLPSGKSIRVNLYHHLGSVEIPAGFSGKVDANWIDAWAGTLETQSPRMEIGWRAGTIQYFSEDSELKKRIVWNRLEGTTELPIKLTLFRETGGDLLVARIDQMEFNVKLTGKDDEEIFTSLVRSYRTERCTGCRYLPVKAIY